MECATRCIRSLQYVLGVSECFLRPGFWACLCSLVAPCFAPLLAATVRRLLRCSLCLVHGRFSWFFGCLLHFWHRLFAWPAGFLAMAWGSWVLTGKSGMECATCCVRSLCAGCFGITPWFAGSPVPYLGSCRFLGRLRERDIYIYIDIDIDIDTLLCSFAGCRCSAPSPGAAALAGLLLW